MQRYLSILFLVRKAYFAGRPYVTCRAHGSLVPILDILTEHGFIRSYELRGGASKVFVI